MLELMAIMFCHFECFRKTVIKTLQKSRDSTELSFLICWFVFKNKNYAELNMIVKIVLLNTFNILAKFYKKNLGGEEGAKDFELKLDIMQVKFWKFLSIVLPILVTLYCTACPWRIVRQHKVKMEMIL